MKRNDKPQKQSGIRVIGNTFWMLKYVFRYAPMLAVDKIIRIPLTVVMAYININLTRWILDSVERGVFSEAVLTIVFLFSSIMAVNCVKGVLAILVTPKKTIDLSAGMRKELIRKVSRIDQKNFQKTEFYDTYTLALDEIDTRASKVLESVTLILSSLFSFFTITGTTSGISSRFAMFGILVPFIDLLLTRLRQQISYRQRLEETPENRKRGYVGRVTYQPEFVSDLKIYPQFRDLLIFRYEQATGNVKRIIGKYAARIFMIDQGQQISAVVLQRALPWIWIAWLLFEQKVSIAEATVLSSAAITIPEVFAKYMNHLGMLYSHSLYIENLRGLFDYDEGIEKDEGRAELGPQADMEGQDISFTYAEELPAALKQISFRIRPGEKLAVVGYNGAGKTTLAKLMIRLFDRTGGRLLLSGRPIEDYSVRSLRSRIAYLSQDFKIYGFTIAENILMHPVQGEKDEELVRSVLKTVGLYEKVAGFEKGIDTFITREFDGGGAYFSGGELQKLALARICAGNYDCIILDESTSALDPVSEDEIIKMIFTIFRDKTIVMISHRLATIQYVDRVIFLSGGVVREEGTHQKLMERQGEYARFYAAQAEKYSMEG